MKGPSSTFLQVQTDAKFNNLPQTIENKTDYPTHTQYNQFQFFCTKDTYLILFSRLFEIPSKHLSHFNSTRPDNSKTADPMPEKPNLYQLKSFLRNTTVLTTKMTVNSKTTWYVYSQPTIS